jgi:predicted transcriptional regulator
MQVRDESRSAVIARAGMIGEIQVNTKVTKSPDDDAQQQLALSVAAHPTVTGKPTAEQKAENKAKRDAIKAQSVAERNETKSAKDAQKLDVSLRKAAGRVETALAVLWQLCDKSKTEDETGRQYWTRFVNVRGNKYGKWDSYIADVLGTECNHLSKSVRDPMIALLQSHGCTQAVTADIMGMTQSQVSRVLSGDRRTQPVQAKERQPKTLAAQFVALVSKVNKVDELSDDDVQGIANALRSLPFDVLSSVLLRTAA